MEKIEKIKPLIYSIELRDPYTKGHSERVAIYASEFLKYLDFGNKQVEDVYYAGLLHDIGKIAIPDSVLLKPSILNPEEYNIIKYHPILSANLVDRMYEFSYLSDIVKHHHENYDGSGYPDRLKGENIPFLSRVLTLADVFDALTTDRIYREAFDFDEAIKILEHMKYKFDPRLFEKFLSFIDKFRIINDKLFHIEEKEEKFLENLRYKIFFEDTFTGLLNRNALMLILRRAIENSLKITMVELNIKNYQLLHKKHGIENVENVIKTISIKIKKEFKDLTVNDPLNENNIYVFKESVARFVFLGFGDSKTFLKKMEPFLDLKIDHAEIDLNVIFKEKELDYNFEKLINYVI